MARVAGMTDQLHQDFTGPDQQFNKLTVGKLIRETANEPALQLMQQSPPATRKLLISEAIRRRRTSVVEAMFTWLLAQETLQTAERYLHGCSSDFVAMRLATGEHWQSEQVTLAHWLARWFTSCLTPRFTPRFALVRSLVHFLVHLSLVHSQVRSLVRSLVHWFTSWLSRCLAQRVAHCLVVGAGGMDQNDGVPHCCCAGTVRD